MKKLLFTLALCLAVAATAFAQASGTVTGSVSDEQGGVLPGVTVTIVGNDRTATFVTEADGKYPLPQSAARHVPTDRGADRLQHRRPRGRGRRRRPDVELPIKLKVATVQETVTVTGESPIVDAKAIGTATNFTQAELDEDADLARSVGAAAHGAGRAWSTA